MITDKTAMVALVPPPALRKELAPYCDCPDRLHLTIASLGEVKDLKACMNSVFKAAYLLDPIEAEIEGLGYLPIYGGKHACVALIGSVGLTKWRYIMAKQLREDGLLKDERHGFIPHMTLCRGTDFFDLDNFPVHFSTWQCSELWLFRGRNLRLRYTVGGVL